MTCLPVVTYVPVSKRTGCVDVEDVLAAVQPNTCLVTVMMANNETGIIQVNLISADLWGGSRGQVSLLTFGKQTSASSVCTGGEVGLQGGGGVGLP